MNHRIALCAGLAALGVAGIMATPVQAQVYLEPGGQAVPPPQHDLGGLPPSEILMAVRSSGLRPLTQPARLGPQQYVVLASDNMGGQLRVVVNANTGRICARSPGPRSALCVPSGAAAWLHSDTGAAARRHGATADLQRGTARSEDAIGAATSAAAYGARRAGAADAAGGCAVTQPESGGRARYHRLGADASGPYAATAPASHDRGERSERSRRASFAGTGAPGRNVA